jgi:hypothetical protein
LKNKIEKKKKEKLKAFNGKMDGKKTMEDP